MTTRRPHYVWRHYLQGWQLRNDRVTCLREGRVFSVNPRRIMIERDFYKLAVMTRENVELLVSFTKRSNAHLGRLNRDFINTMVHIANTNVIIQRGDASHSDKKFAQSLVIEAEDRIHGQIERNVLPILRELRQQRTDFLTDRDLTISFFHYLAHQYFRTKTMRNRIGDVLNAEFPGRGAGRLQNLLCYCSANNLGSSLYVDRKNLDITFVENASNVDLVTGDQPVVNLLSTEGEEPPEEVIIYYPLSPRVGLLVAPRQYNVHSGDLGQDRVAELNRFIAWQSSQFLVSRSICALEEFVDGWPKRKPPIPGIVGQGQ